MLAFLAEQEGIGAFSKTPRDFVAPGGDRWIVALRDEDGARAVEIVREPSAYDVDGARNRLVVARNELAGAMKTLRSAEDALASEPDDPSIVAHAEAVRDDARASAKRLSAEVRSLEPQAVAREAQTWRFAPGLPSLSFAVGGA